MSLAIGPVILDLLGPELSAEEREILQHPLVGGIILFARHYQSPVQITQLCQQVRKVRSTPLLITVDQEGGRVQRFRSEFTRLPSMEQIGDFYAEAPHLALQLAEVSGWLMAAEVLSVGIDLSFAPVLDLNKKINSAISDRAFHWQPQVAAKLAIATIQGMFQAGMAAVGKHFPGHGSVSQDSHTSLPVDQRSFNEIAEDDLIVFAELIKAGIPALMPAHILFPAVDSRPVGFSPLWLQTILRNQLKFTGMLFSDDLNMEGAGIIGDYAERASAALTAGCDMILICNNRAGAIQILDKLPKQQPTLDESKFKMLQGHVTTSFVALRESSIWQEKHNFLMSKLEHILI